LLRRENPIVQLFVFHHECGHHRVGASELGADCWAIGRGVRDGWLNSQGLSNVCESFGNAPETSTHPSSRRRCANLDRCFATSTAEVARERGRTQMAAAPPVSKLVSGPRFLWSGRG
jgi:hypothetical protein